MSCVRVVSDGVRGVGNLGDTEFLDLIRKSSAFSH